jgi:hypothetical protein
VPTDQKLDLALITGAERLLTEAWVGQVRLGEAETLRADRCYRFVVTHSPAGAPTSVIVQLLLSPSAVPLDRSKN